MISACCSFNILVIRWPLTLNPPDGQNPVLDIGGSQQKGAGSLFQGGVSQITSGGSESWGKGAKIRQNTPNLTPARKRIKVDKKQYYNNKSGKDLQKRNVFKCRRKIDKDGDDCTSEGREFHVMAATGNDRRLISIFSYSRPLYFTTLFRVLP